MPTILRIRYIPDETVDISSDRLLYRDEEHLVTAWKPIRPRKDIHGGVSCLFLSEGIKVSRFLGPQGELLYWYIDIIDARYDPQTDTYALHDLLADVRIWPDGRVDIIDLDELADAMAQQLITPAQAQRAIRILHALLEAIQSGTQPATADRWMDDAMGNDTV